MCVDALYCLQHRRLQELQAAVDALDLERSSTNGLPVLSVASTAIAEVPFPFEHKQWPQRRQVGSAFVRDGTDVAAALQADCRRVAIRLERWLNEALQTFVPLATLSFEKTPNSDTSAPGAVSEQRMDPAERLWRKFLLLPPHVELYGHQAPD